MAASEILIKLIKKAGEASFTPSAGAPPAAEPSLLDKGMALGGKAVDAVKPLVNQGIEAAKPVVNGAIDAGKNEIAQAKPMLEQAGAAVKPYFNGIGEHPLDWAKAHPIGAGVGAVGAVGAAALLAHLLGGQQKRRHPALKLATDAAHPLYEGMRMLFGGAGRGAKALASKAIQHPITATAMTVGPAAAFTAGKLSHPAPAASTPAPTAATGAPASGAPAGAPGTPGAKDDTILGMSKGTATGLGLGVGAAALLAHLLSRPSNEDDTEE